MGKIVPDLWFDRETEEAAQFYTRLFDNFERVNLN